MKFGQWADPAPILGLYSTPSMNTFYRLITPMRAIGGSWAPINQVYPAQLEAAETVLIHALGGMVRDVRAAIADLRKRWGIRRILVDYDDAMFHPHPFPKVRMKPYQVRSVYEALRLSDGVVVTNTYNRDLFARYTDKPIAVVPNLIIPEDWPDVPPPQDARPVIVLAGSPSHHYDWGLIIPALEQIRQQLPDVGFRLLGYGHPLLKQIATQGGGGWLRGPAYQQALAGGAIGLCPLPSTAFNQGKSPIKALEYSLSAGMAVIGSTCQYAELLGDERGLVVRDDHRFGWHIALGAYLSDPAMRQADAARLRSHILMHYDARRYAAELLDIYAQRAVDLTPIPQEAT